MDSLYFSALQSFVVLARTTRMQEATKELGVSRQTIMRHLNHLYELRGGPLLKLQGNSYFVTESGAEFLAGAEKLLEQATILAGGHGLHVDVVDGLERVRFSTEHGQKFVSQQHPLWQIDEFGTPTIKKAFHAWLRAKFDIKHPAIQSLMPILNIFREQEYGWVCVHVGTETAYARFFGKEWAMSAIGSLQEDAPTGKNYQMFVSQPYKRVLAQGFCRFDHHYLQAGTDAAWPIPYLTYQRLLMPFLLPDGSPTLVSLAIISQNVDYGDFELPPTFKISEEFLMDVEIP